MHRNASVESRNLRPRNNGVPRRYEQNKIGERKPKNMIKDNAESVIYDGGKAQRIRQKVQEKELKE
jgi:hypothetical protein